MNEESQFGTKDELKPEYDFDYRQAQPNRFAKKRSDGSLVVIFLLPSEFCLLHLSMPNNKQNPA